MREFIIKGLSSFLNYSNPISLMYHTISNNIASIAISEKELISHFEYLKDNNYKIIGEYEQNIKSKQIHLTFDDGYEDNYSVLFPLLEKYKYNATIFITTGFLGKKFKYDLPLMTKEQIFNISKSELITIGSHTVNHPKLDLLSYNEQYKEIADSKMFLENLINKKVDIFAPPFGRYNNNTLKIIKELDFKKSYTTKIGKLNCKNLLEISRVPVMKSTSKYFDCLDKDGYFLYNNLKDRIKKYV